MMDASEERLLQVLRLLHEELNMCANGEDEFGSGVMYAHLSIAMLSIQRMLGSDCEAARKFTSEGGVWLV
jgi:hypothetical protein